MKMLTVSLLVCAMMALTGADGEENWTNTSDNTTTHQAVPEAEPDEKAEPSDQEEEIQIVKMSTRYYAYYGGRRFTYFPTPLSWANAEKNCQRLGGNLASVHSFAEYSVIRNLIFKVTNTYPHTWLGGSDAQQEGTWFWSDGTRFDFTYWDGGQPDNYQNADCLVMNFGGSKRFDDQPCHYGKPSVCAKKA